MASGVVAEGYADLECPIGPRAARRLATLLGESDGPGTHTRTPPETAMNELEARNELQMLVDSQADDEGLWCCAETAMEGYLQQELRKLHAAVEALRDAGL